MLRNGLAAGVSATGVWPLVWPVVWAVAAVTRANRPRPAAVAASRRRGIRMAPNVVRVFRQNRGKIDASGAVVRVSGEQLLGPVDLLGQHRPGEQMGPGHRAEREDQRGFLQQRFAMAVGAAD